MLVTSFFCTFAAFMRKLERNRIVLLLFCLFSAIAVRAQHTGVSSDSVVYHWVLNEQVPVYRDNTVKLLKSGQEKFTDMFQAIREAKKSVHLEYFNFRNDSIANALFNLLSVKVKQGVEVRALYDAFGNMSNNRPLKNRHVAAIRNMGIQLFKWDPVKFPWVNHVYPRDHRKIVVIDDEIAYTGGMNVADYYVVGLPEIGQWRDMHMRIEGGAVKELQKAFHDSWKKETRQDLDEYVYKQPAALQPVNHQDSLLLHLKGTEEEWNKAVQIMDLKLRKDARESGEYHAGPVNHATDEYGRVIPLHPLQESREHNAMLAVLDRVPRQTPAIMRNLYTVSLDAAQEKVLIINPYFAPTHKVKKALKRAIDRGVDVQIMIPSKSDIMFTPDAAYNEVNKLRKRGAKVFLYDGGFHHSKVMMVDDKFCTVGSTNLDSRSLRYDYELNVVVFDKGVTNELVTMFENDAKDSRVLTDDVWKSRSLWKRLVGRFASLLSFCL